MTIAVFQKICSRNVSGNSRIFVAEASNVSAIAVTAGEISTITGAGAFKEIEVEMDSIVRIEEKIAGKLNHAYDISIDIKLARPSVSINTLRTSLGDASPCGMLALVKDGNGEYWLVGYNELDLVNRPLFLAQDNMTSGAELIDPEGNKISARISRSMAEASLPLDATLAGEIDDGTAAFCSFAGCDAFDNLCWNCGFRADEELCTTDWDDTNTDGIADDWARPSGAGSPSIVTGNGFSGNAQRVPHVTGTLTRFSQATGVNAVIGKTYRITGKYRADSDPGEYWRIYLRSTADPMTTLLADNTGSAIEFSEEVVATAAAEIIPCFYKIGGDGNAYIEIDEVRVWQID